MSYGVYHSVINVIYDIYDMYGALALTDTIMYVCQYGCQKKRKDLRNAANHLRYPNKLFEGPKTEISCLLVFSFVFFIISFAYFA